VGRITQEQIDKVCILKDQKLNHRDISEKVFGVRTRASTVWHILDRNYYNQKRVVQQGAKILVFDIETAAQLSYHWGDFNQNIGLNMKVRDWFVLSWAAKWIGNDTVMYEDIREQFDGSAESILKQADDSLLLQQIWNLLDEADIVVTQNGVRFDSKKLNTRFIQVGMKPPSSYKHIDTLLIAKRHFGFTSNKLEYMTDKLCKKYKKLNHAKFSGFDLWKQCELGNEEAWEEMEEYNRYDVLSLEELVFILAPWSNKLPNLDMYYEDEENHCFCGSTEWEQSGFSYTNLSKFTKFRCTSCGAEKRDRVNLLTKSKRASLVMNVT